MPRKSLRSFCESVTSERRDSCRRSASRVGDRSVASPVKRVGEAFVDPYLSTVTLTLNLPDEPAAHRWSEDDLRLELACAMHARGRLSKTAGAEMAGLDFFSFQEALAERGIAVETVADLHEDVAALRAGFPTVETLQPHR